MIKRYLRKVIERLREVGDEGAVHLRPKSKEDMTACWLPSWTYMDMDILMVSSNPNEVTCDACKRSKEYLELTNQRIKKLYNSRGR